MTYLVIMTEQAPRRSHFPRGPQGGSGRAEKALGAEAGHLHCRAACELPGPLWGGTGFFSLKALVGTGVWAASQRYVVVIVGGSERRPGPSDPQSG